MTDEEKKIKGQCYLCQNFCVCTISGYPVDNNDNVIPDKEPNLVIEDVDNLYKIIICSRCCRVLRVLLDKLR